MNTGLSGAEGLYVGRVWREGIGPAVVCLRGGRIVDITTKAAPTMRGKGEKDLWSVAWSRAVSWLGHVQRSFVSIMASAKAHNHATSLGDGPTRAGVRLKKIALLSRNWSILLVMVGMSSRLRMLIPRAWRGSLC